MHEFHVSINSETRAGVVSVGSDNQVKGSYYEKTSDVEPNAEPGDRSNIVLIVVVADVEREAVWSQVRPLTGEPRRRPRTGVEFVYDLGRIGDADVVMARVDQGAVTPGSAGPAMPDLLRVTGAAHVILTGICYGLKDDDARDPQHVGDVLVATELRAIGHFKTTEDEDGAPQRQERGGRPVASTVLVKLIREARHGWRNAAAVHFGPVVSESVLCASREHRERIRQAEPQAIGGEMEGAAVFAAAERAGVPWAVVKAISDWGYDKDDRHQHLAADNAASLVIRTIQLGGLSPGGRRTAL